MKSPVQAAFVEKSAEEQGFALQQRHKQKCSKYEELCLPESIVFQPLVVETFGGWDRAAADTIAKIGKSLARTSGQEDTTVIRHLFGRLSVLLMKDNANLLLNRVPTHPDTQVNGSM